MSFSDSQKHELGAKLSSANVKSRRQGSTNVSYIEGWHVIAEANRIFGFDGWTRETLDVKCVAEKEREIGEKKIPGWGVTYIVKSRLTVEGIVREGCGAGHGIDRDLGQAHESALKEAETDSMKRAFMTFGNPFGLALYDKTRENVETERPTEPAHMPFPGDRIQGAKVQNGAQEGPKPDGKPFHISHQGVKPEEWVEEYLERVKEAKDDAEILAWEEANRFPLGLLKDKFPALYQRAMKL